MGAWTTLRIAARPITWQCSLKHTDSLRRYAGGGGPMPEQTAEVKMYSDYKSPYAYVAFDPGMELEQKYNVRVRWRPFQLRIKGKGQRSVYSEYKVKYSYLDARRWANLRGGLVIKGPLKIYDTTPAL